MLNSWRNKLPDIEDAGGAAMDSVAKAAAVAAQSAKDASIQLEEWAKDGFDSVKARPMIWGAASLGFGALMGGLFAVLRKSKPNGRAASPRTVAARSRSKQALRASVDSATPATKKRRSRKAPPRAAANKSRPTPNA
ncbi:MAG TPA: hypothetical protein VHT51_13305 [Micropepsaceae bacterium]|jgi:hypothetical protein|nr:hypothetical protein [Micropepsaceae bacterium]